MYHSLLLGALACLAACSDLLDDDEESSGGTEYYGYFLDSGVVGLSYTPNNDFEWTEGNGRFFYTPGSVTEGECKEVRFGNSGSSNQITFDTYDNASGQPYACDYPSNWDELTATKTETFNINSAYIESTSSNDDRRCYLLGIDDYELDNLYVACEVSGNHSKFEIELWRGL